MSVQTLGEKRVRLSFNPSEKDQVLEVKKATASLIDTLDRQICSSDEKSRLIEIAILKYEEAAMWAVKALTA